MTLRLYIVFLLLCIVISLGYAQKPDLRFEKHTDKNGRTLGFINSIIQDENGLIWFTSNNGLYKYDGYTYSLYKYSSKDSFSIPFKNITKLYCDNNGTFWLKGYDQFAAFKNEKLDTSYRFVTDNFYEIETKIIQDRNNNFWIGPTEKGIIRISIDGTSEKVYTHSPPLYPPKVYQNINSLVAKKGNTICSIENVKNNVDTVVHFSIHRKTNALVVCVGEGDVYDFFDYGYITKSGDVVWEFSLDKSKFAGGAKNNKIQAEVISLPKGNYSLHYKSDNSNSFRAWQEGDAPDKTKFYGISIINTDTGIADLQNSLNENYTPDNHLSSNDIKDMIINNNGCPVFLTPKGLDIYQEDEQRFKRVDIDFNFIQGLDPYPEITPYCVFLSSDDKYFIGTNYGFIMFDPLTNSAKGFKNTPGKLPLLTSNSIFTIYEDSQNRIWLGTQKGITLFDRLKNTFFKYEANNHNKLWDNYVFRIFEDNSSTIWVGTKEGLNRLNKSRLTFYDLQTETYTSPIHIDQLEGSDKFWFHAKENIIASYDRSKNKFLSFPIDENFFSYNPITQQRFYTIDDIYETAGLLWFAIDDGIYLFDRKKEIIIDSIDVSPIYFGPSDNIEDRDSTEDKVRRIFGGDGSNLWLFTVNGIYQYDILRNKTSNFFSFGNTYEFVYDIDFDFVRFVHKDKTGTFWIRTSKGVFTFNTGDKKLKLTYPFEEEIQGTSSTEGNIYEDFDGNIWFAFLPKIITYKNANADSREFVSDIKGDYGMCNIRQDADSAFWIFSDNGLFRFDKDKNSFKHYTTDDGLVNNFVNGFIDDNRGNLWITSTFGLTKMDKQNEEFENISMDLTENKFLGVSEENREAKGEILFITEKGFYSFHPDSINWKKPQVLITEFNLSGEQTIHLNNLIYNIDTLRLKYFQNFFSFEFASMDYTDPMKNMYAYKLDGLDKNWIYVDATNRKAGYTGISPGDYVFHVKASNNDKIWNEEGVKIHIFIKPPFWKTTWFIILNVIAGLFLVYIFIKWRERNLQREKRILEEKVAERTKEIERQKKEIEEQYTIVAEQKKNIMDSIYYASRIQTALLPPEEHMKKVLPEHFILNKPRDIVSGDYYWMTQKNEKIIITAADCTGHGVPGAFMSMLGVSFLNEIVNKGNIIHANEILNKLKSNVIKSLHQTGKENEAKDGMDIALSVLDLQNSKAEFAGAYNPLFLIRNGELETIKADRMPIGIYTSDKESFSNNEFDIQKGDTLYMFSDGFCDQFGGKDGRKFMTKRFKRLLLSIQHLNMDEQKDHLNEIIEEWMGKKYEQIDDILVIGVRI